MAALRQKSRFNLLPDCNLEPVFRHVIELAHVIIFRIEAKLGAVSSGSPGDSGKRVKAMTDVKVSRLGCRRSRKLLDD